MKIEAGKYYKLRNGKKAYVFSVITEHPFSKIEIRYAVRGYIEGRDGEYVWTVKGEAIHDNVREYDIIEEWKDPRTWEVVIYVCEADAGYFYSASSTEKEFRPTNNKIVASKKITITEGEGLNVDNDN